MMRKIERTSPGQMRPGQDLVAAGYAGLAGTAQIVRAKRDELERRFTGGYLDGILTCSDLMQDPVWEYWKSAGASEWEAAGEGGILAALWNLSGAYETGISVFLRRIPIRQETVEICECFGLNPYRLYSGGCSLLAADNGGRLVESLAADGIPADVIGSVNHGITREILGVGARGFLTRPQPDELEKVITKTGGSRK